MKDKTLLICILLLAFGFGYKYIKTEENKDYNIHYKKDSFERTYGYPEDDTVNTYDTIVYTVEMLKYDTLENGEIITNSPKHPETTFIIRPTTGDTMWIKSIIDDVYKYEELITE